uniref:WAP four-disulfide core domain protein 5 n=2 Tax=Pan troglodytes TaxID=9598 RepID=A0A2K6I0L7_PANTR
MRTQSLLLLGALLAVGSQLPAVFGRKKGEKSGGCPPDDGPCLLSVPDQCVEDSQCPLTRKCCYRACFRQCVPRVSVKLGSCPEDQLRCLSPMNHLCHKDSDCSGKKRCCHSACGRDCRDPARGTAPGCPGQANSDLGSVALHLGWGPTERVHDGRPGALPAGQHYLYQRWFQPSDNHWPADTSLQPIHPFLLLGVKVHSLSSEEDLCITLVPCTTAIRASHPS